MADPDQLSPEYGGTGSRQQDLPSLADALYAAGSSGGSGNESGVTVNGYGGSSRNGGRTPDGSSSSGRNNADGEAHSIRPRGGPYLPATTPGDGDLEEEKDVEKEEKGAEGRERLASKGGGGRNGAGVRPAPCWGPVGWFWRAWGGSAADFHAEGRGLRDNAGYDDAEESIAASDEEVRTTACLRNMLFWLVALACA